MLISMCNYAREHLKALVFLYAFEESVDCHLLSSFCDNSNLHISLFKYVISTMGVSKESISKFLIGNGFHVKLHILSQFMCNFTWNRFPIKNLLIDSLLTPIVETRAVESESRSWKDFQPEESESKKILTTPTPGRPFAHQLWLFVPQTSHLAI